MKFFEKLRSWILLGKEIEKDLYVTTETRDTFIATFQNRKMRIYVERLSGKPNRIVYSGKGRKWLAPYDQELVSD